MLNATWMYHVVMTFIWVIGVVAAFVLGDLLAKWTGPIAYAATLAVTFTFVTIVDRWKDERRKLERLPTD